MNILHKLIYRRFVQKALPYLTRYFYIGPNERDFSTRVYHVPERIMEFLPLGGIIPDNSFFKSAKKMRSKHGIDEDELVFVHSGKLSSEKKTKMLLNAFVSNKTLKARLLIIGSIPEETCDEIESIINSDKRIEYLGWMDSNSLQQYLCECDLYCQPGSPSSTLQNAICCGCAIMSQPLSGYKMIDRGNFLWIESEKDISVLFANLSEGKLDLEKYKKQSMACARELLDYRTMERRIRELAQKGI